MHPGHVCDGIFQCPYLDDELACHFLCPTNCLCQGYALVCPQPFNVTTIPKLRYIDVTYSGIKLQSFSNLPVLIYLKASFCNLTDLARLSLPNLRTLDISYNDIMTLDMVVFTELPNLKQISVAANPISEFHSSINSKKLNHLLQIDLSFSGLESLDPNVFDCCEKIRLVNLSFSQLKTIHNNFPTSDVEVLDFGGTSLELFEKGVLSNLSKLTSIRVDDWRLCCPEMLPDKFNLQMCHGPEDSLASCTNLLGSEVIQGCVWVLFLLGITGNIFSIGWSKTIRHMPQGLRFMAIALFSTHLLMSFSLGVILVADLWFSGNFVEHHVNWIQGSVCAAIGFITMFSFLLVFYLPFISMVFVSFPFQKF